MKMKMKMKMEMTRPGNSPTGKARIKPRSAALEQNAVLLGDGGGGR